MGESLIKKLRRRQEKQAFDDMARELVLEKWADFCTKADIVILYTLWKEFGFGRKRLEDATGIDIVALQAEGDDAT